MYHYKKGKIFLIGIGGIGMSGLAEILHNSGYQVFGSDLNEGSNVKRLKKLGIFQFQSKFEKYLHQKFLYSIPIRIFLKNYLPIP